MNLMDTDHTSLLERGGAPALPLTLKLSGLRASEIAASIVTYYCHL